MEIKDLLGEDIRKVPLLAMAFLLSSFLDILGIGLIAPYIALVIRPSPDFTNQVASWFSWIGLSFNPSEILDFMGVCLVIVFLLKFLMVFFINRMILKFSFYKSLKMREQFLGLFQFMPYERYLGSNSSKYIYSVLTLTSIFAESTLQCILKVVSELLVIAGVFILLFYKIGTPLIFISIFLFAILVLYNKVYRKRLLLKGRVIDEESKNVLQSVTEALSGLRDIRILGKEHFFRTKVVDSSRLVIEALISSTLISTMPRYFLEFLLVCIVVITVFSSKLYGADSVYIASSLGMLGVAGVRLLPSFNLILSGLAQITKNRNAVGLLHREYRELQGVVQNVRKNLDEQQAMGSFESLSLKKLSFSYSDKSSKALDNVDLELLKGQFVGLSGPSGSGKSTLVNILLGFLEHQSGDINLKTTNAERKSLSDLKRFVSYVPQDIFLIDDSLKCNVALGVPKSEIDEDRVIYSLKKSNLFDTIMALPDGIETFVGESGMRLSGGQRQRIAIARAFYFDRDVIILDEATSALDIETELEIIEEIRNLKSEKTILMITHRLSTLSYCDRVLNIINGRVEEVDEYNSSNS